MTNAKLLEMLYAKKTAELRADIVKEVLPARKTAAIKRFVKKCDAEKGKRCKIEYIHESNLYLFGTPYAMVLLSEENKKYFPEDLPVFQAKSEEDKARSNLRKNTLKRIFPYVREPQVWQLIDFDALFADLTLQGYKFSKSRLLGKPEPKVHYYVRVEDNYYNLDLLEAVYGIMQNGGLMRISINPENDALYITTGRDYGVVMPINHVKGLPPEHIVKASKYYHMSAIEEKIAC